jgi:hypothetical protein
VNAVLTKGNTKIGPSVWAFNIPAVKTCPGATEACRSVCYATKYRFKADNVARRASLNLRLSRRDDFPSRVIDEVAEKRVKLLRFHCSGDFYDLVYAQKWLAVMNECPGTVFYGYTRSWRRKGFTRLFAEMAEMPNVFLWFSVDHSSGMPWEVPDRVRLAYLSLSASDQPPAQADLVFRDHGDRPRKAIRMNGVLVCPHENGVPARVCCEECRLCLGGRDPREMKTAPERGRLALQVV